MSKIDCVHLMCFTLAPLCNFERVYTSPFFIHTVVTTKILLNIYVYLYLYILIFCSKVVFNVFDLFTCKKFRKAYRVLCNFLHHNY